MRGKCLGVAVVGVDAPMRSARRYSNALKTRKRADGDILNAESTRAGYVRVDAVETVMRRALYNPHLDSPANLRPSA
jgi:hypothetical protein